MQKTETKTSLESDRDSLLKQFQELTEKRMQVLGAINYINQKIEEKPDAKIREKKQS
mgnify:CR=1 FL=1